MRKTENDCVGPCPMGCISCGRKRVMHFYCDICGEETEELYELHDDELCKECLLDACKINLTNQEEDYA